MVSAEEVVLSSDGERSDRILDSVVVDVISAIKDITAQAWEKSIGVDQSLSHSGFWSEASGHGVHPVLELLYYFVGLLLTAFPDCIMIKTGFLHLLFDTV